MDATGKVIKKTTGNGIHYDHFSTEKEFLKRLLLSTFIGQRIDGDEERQTGESRTVVNTVYYAAHAFLY